MESEHRGDTVLIKVANGNYRLYEDYYGNLVLETTGNSRLEIEGGNKNSVWKLYCDQSVIVHRNFNGKTITMDGK